MIDELMQANTNSQTKRLSPASCLPSPQIEEFLQKYGFEEDKSGMKDYSYRFDEIELSQINVEISRTNQARLFTGRDDKKSGHRIDLENLNKVEFGMASDSKFPSIVVFDSQDGSSAPLRIMDGNTRDQASRNKGYTHVKAYILRCSDLQKIRLVTKKANFELNGLPPTKEECLEQAILAVIEGQMSQTDAADLWNVRQKEISEGLRVRRANDLFGKNKKFWDLSSKHKLELESLSKEVSLEEATKVAKIYAEYPTVPASEITKFGTLYSTVTDPAVRNKMLEELPNSLKMASRRLPKVSSSGRTRKAMTNEKKIMRGVETFANLLVAIPYSSAGLTPESEKKLRGVIETARAWLPN